MKKPVKKDQPRQARRQRTLARLEALLAGGVRKLRVPAIPTSYIKGKIATFEKIGGPLTEGAIARITYDIRVLRERLGLSVAVKV